MNRFYRRVKSLLRPTEIAALLLAAAVAVASGYGAWFFYRHAAARVPMVVAINSIGAARDGAMGGLQTAGGGDSPQSGDGYAQSVARLGDDAIPRGVDAVRGVAEVAGFAPADQAAAHAMRFGGHGQAAQAGSGMGAGNGASAGNGAGAGSAAGAGSGAGADAGAVADADAGANAGADAGAGSGAGADAGSGAGANAGADAGAGAGAGAGADGASGPFSAEPFAAPQEMHTVIVVADGARSVFVTPSKTVGELLSEHGISLSEHDIVSGAYLDGTIDSDLYIEIRRVAFRTVDVEEPIPRATVYRDNASLEIGKTRVLAEGKDGLKLSKYLVTLVDGVEESRKLVKSPILAEPVDRVVEQGKGGNSINIDGKSVRYTKKIENVKCTAYTSSYEDTGKRPGDPGYGITKNGMEAREGIVAVDPAIIPLNSMLYIEITEEGVPDYGVAIAGDTGSKIKGKKVDLYFDWEREELLKFGVKAANIYILGGD